MQSTDKLRLLFVVNTLKRLGAEQQLFSFVKALPARLDISVFRFSNDADEFPELLHSDRFRVYSSKYIRTYNILKFRPLLDCLSHEKFDIAVTVGLGAALFFGRLCAALKGVRVIYSTLNTFENFHNLPKLHKHYFDIFNDLLNIVLPALPGKRIFRFFPNSDELTKMVRKHVRGYPVETLYNGFLISEFQNDVNMYELTDEIKNLVSRFQGFPTIVQVGAIDDNKNQAFTLQCLASIKKRIPDIRLLVIGSGPKKPELTDLALTKGLTDTIVFTGEMERTACLYLISRSDILVVTSYSESFPNVLVEAQALSRPVVTFDVGAVSEIVEHGVTGYVSRMGDSAAFTNYIVELFAKKDLSKTMGEMGKKRVFTNFEMKTKVERFLSIASRDFATIHPAIAGETLDGPNFTQEP